VPGAHADDITAPAGVAGDLRTEKLVAKPDQDTTAPDLDDKDLDAVSGGLNPQPLPPSPPPEPGHEIRF
jgi:hypothetical protein